MIAAKTSISEILFCVLIVDEEQNQNHCEIIVEEKQ